MTKYKPGTKMNYLTILRVVPDPVNRKVICRCDCGKIKEFYLSNIIPRSHGRYTSSCGCRRLETFSKSISSHRMSNTRFYKCWRSMFDRTTSNKYVNAHSYKGIKVCKRWAMFENFMKDMFEEYNKHSAGFTEKNTTLDRIDTTKGYSKKNCKWSTQKEQSRNKRGTIKVEYGGKLISLKDLCEMLGKNYGTVYARMKVFNFTLEQSLNKEPWKRI